MAITKTYFATSSAASSVADSDYIVVQQGTGTDGALNEMKKATIAQVRKPLKDVIDAASLAQVGGTGKYVSQMSQSSGAVYASEVSFVTGIGKLTSANPSVPPTAKAVVEFVNSEAETGGVIYDTAKSAVNAVNANTQGGVGSYIRTISQSSGVITAVPQNFDTSITENTGNAPTSKAVKTYVENQIAGLDSDVGNSSTLVKSIAERDGKLTGETIALDSSTLASGVPTSQVVKNAINSLNGSVGVMPGTGVLIKSITESSGVITGTTIEITDTVENDPNKIPNSQAVYNSQQGAIFTALGALELDEVGQDGYYIKKVSQADGQLSAVKQKFDDTVTTSTANAPNSSAVKTYVDAASLAVKNRIDGLNQSTQGGNGKYIRAFSQSSGAASAVSASFETGPLVQRDSQTYQPSTGTYLTGAVYDNNSPTVKAVAEQIYFLDNRIKKSNDGVASLTMSYTASSGAYIMHLEQEAGQVGNIEQKYFSSSVELGDLNAPSASAVRTTINDLTVPQTGAAGYYLNTIKEDQGKITATTKQFEQSVRAANSAGNNAPSELAVRTAIDTAKQEVLEQSEAMTYLGSVNSSAAIMAKASEASRAGRPLYDIGDTFISNADFNLNGTSEKAYDVRSGDMLVVKTTSASYSATLFDIISGSKNTVMFAGTGATVNNFAVFSAADGRSIVDSGTNITTLENLQIASASSADYAAAEARAAASSAIFADAEVEPYRQNAASAAEEAERQKGLATTSAEEAEAQRQNAASAANEAEVQKGLATTSAGTAETKKQNAASAANEAEVQKGNATTSAEEAETQRQNAASAAEEAEAQKGNATTSAGAAETQRQNAASAAGEAERQKGLATSAAGAAETQRQHAASAAEEAEAQKGNATSAAGAAETQRQHAASAAEEAERQKGLAVSAATFAELKGVEANTSAQHAADADAIIGTFANRNNMLNILNDCTASSWAASSSASLAGYIVSDCVMKTSVTGPQRIISQQLEMAPNTTASAAFYVTNTGSVLGYDFNAVSSRKLKENIRPTIISALDIIDKVNVVDFNYISDDEKKPHIGFIAEDTDPLLSTPHMNGMDYTNCIGTLLKAVQEITKGMEKLEKRIDKLGL